MNTSISTYQKKLYDVPAESLLPIALSIIIVNYKTAELTLDLIQSIYDHAPDVTYEILVMDNGSDEYIEEDLRNRFPAVRFFETGRNVGFAKANNLGIHNSHGSYVLLLNSDTRIFDETLQSMMDYLQIHPNVGVLGPRQIGDDGKYVPSCGNFPTLISEMLRKIIHERLSMDDYRLREGIDDKYANSTNVDWVSGSCLVVRRKALADVGLLDERFFMYFEDIDFCKRIKDKGWQVQYFPDETILHYGGQSAKLNIMKIMVENRKSQLYFSRKHYGVLGAFVVRYFLWCKFVFNFMRWGLVFLGLKTVGKPSRKIYARVLFSKKVIMMSLGRVMTKPNEPRLFQKHSVSETIHSVS